VRNYKQEYNRYHKQLKQKKRRAGRNKARRMMTKKVGKAKLNGKDVDHKDRNPNNNSKSNLRVIRKTLNRSRNG
tara:strand:+ start:502 stop:723 length:222 start_codon:yes stop_codon:yes gene_type:complete